MLGMLWKLMTGEPLIPAKTSDGRVKQIKTYKMQVDEDDDDGSNWVNRSIKAYNKTEAMKKMKERNPGRRVRFKP